MPEPRLSIELLRELTDELVTRMAADLMIGFHFARVDLATLRDREHAHAARSFGHDLPAAARSLEAAHRGHRILGAQFDRRLVILKRLLVERSIPSEAIAEWVEHEESQRSRVVSGECSAR